MADETVPILLAAIEAARTINTQSMDAIARAIRGEYVEREEDVVVRNVAMNTLRACVENINELAQRRAQHANVHHIIITDDAIKKLRLKCARSSPRARAFPGRLGNRSYLTIYGYNPYDDEDARFSRLAQAIRETSYTTIIHCLRLTASRMRETNREWATIIDGDIAKLRADH